jgi:hypothetical protein
VGVGVVEAALGDVVEDEVGFGEGMIVRRVRRDASGASRLLVLHEWATMLGRATDYMRKDIERV